MDRPGLEIDGERSFRHAIGMSTTAITEAAPASAGASEWMTAEEFLALPENDQVERWLLKGKLTERPMTRRSFSHSRTEAQVAHLLKRWVDQQPEPRGIVVSGEAGFRLSRNPDSSVGIDVAYISAERVATTPKNAYLVEGAPVLAVEILSPSDRNDDVTAKIQGYLDAGVKLIWQVEPTFGTVMVYRPDAEPEGFNVHDELDGGSHLPGFRVKVAEVFA